jgi:hypothetical protein
MIRGWLKRHSAMMAVNSAKSFSSDMAEHTNFVLGYQLFEAEKVQKLVSS